MTEDGACRLTTINGVALTEPIKSRTVAYSEGIVVIPSRSGVVSSTSTSSPDSMILQLTTVRENGSPPY
jgi:hypothetical protein